jgi:hypothetical protein
MTIAGSWALDDGAVCDGAVLWWVVSKPPLDVAFPHQRRPPSVEGIGGPEYGGANNRGVLTTRVPKRSMARDAKITIPNKRTMTVAA